ncbi:MAG: thermonuclease family protein [Stappiaceae bacterium]
MTRKTVVFSFLMIAVVAAAGAILWFGQSPSTHSQEANGSPPIDLQSLTETTDREGAGKDIQTAKLELRGGVDSEEEAATPNQPVYEDRSVRNVTPTGITRSQESTGPLKRIKSAIRKPEKPKRARKEAVTRPVINAAGFLENTKKQRFPFAHIEALEQDAECTLASGEKWPCGVSARTALRRLVRGRTVECTADEVENPSLEIVVAETSKSDVDAEAEIFFTCRLGNIQINRWLVAYGWARPAGQPDETYAKLEQTARSQNRGQWRASPPQPLSDVVVTGSVDSLTEALGGPPLEIVDNISADDTDPLPEEQNSETDITAGESDEAPIVLDWQEPNILGDLR